MEQWKKILLTTTVEVKLGLKMRWRSEAVHLVWIKALSGPKLSQTKSVWSLCSPGSIKELTDQ